jgi:hypothetical protein
MDEVDPGLPGDLGESEGARLGLLRQDDLLREIVRLAVSLDMGGRSGG